MYLKVWFSFVYLRPGRIKRKRVLNIKKILGKDINICYAMKANPFIIEEMKDYIDRYEVCSPGEYEICQRHSVKKDVIIVSGG